MIIFFASFVDITWMSMLSSYMNFQSLLFFILHFVYVCRHIQRFYFVFLIEFLFHVQNDFFPILLLLFCVFRARYFSYSILTTCRETHINSIVDSSICEERIIIVMWCMEKKERSWQKLEHLCCVLSNWKLLSSWHINILQCKRIYLNILLN